MSAYPPQYNSNMASWNPLNYEYYTDTSLTVAEADSRYLQLGGGTEVGQVTFSAGENITSGNVTITNANTNNLDFQGNTSSFGTIKFQNSSSTTEASVASSTSGLVLTDSSVANKISLSATNISFNSTNIITELTNIENYLNSQYPSGISAYVYDGLTFQPPSMSYASQQNVFFNQSGTNGIQNALDYVGLNFSGGGIVMLQSGTFYLQGSLTLYSNIIFQGQGNGSTIIDCTAVSGNIMTGTNVSNVLIKDIQFINSSTSNNATNISFTGTTGCNDIELRNCYFNFAQISSGSQPQIQFGNSTQDNYTYQRCNVRNCVLTGMNLQYCSNYSDCSVTDNIFYWETNNSSTSSYLLRLYSYVASTAKTSSSIQLSRNKFIAQSGINANAKPFYLNNNTTTGLTYGSHIVKFENNTFDMTNLATTAYLFTNVNNAWGTTQNADAGNNVFSFSNNIVIGSVTTQVFKDANADGTSSWAGTYNFFNNTWTSGNTIQWFNAITSVNARTATFKLNVCDMENLAWQTATYVASGSLTPTINNSSQGNLILHGKNNQLQILPSNNTNTSPSDSGIVGYTFSASNPTQNITINIPDPGVPSGYLLYSGNSYGMMMGLICFNLGTTGILTSGTSYRLYYQESATPWVCANSGYISAGGTQTLSTGAYLSTQFIKSVIGVSQCSTDCKTNGGTSVSPCTVVSWTGAGSSLSYVVFTASNSTYQYVTLTYIL